MEMLYVTGCWYCGISHVKYVFELINWVTNMFYHLTAMQYIYIGFRENLSNVIKITLLARYSAKMVNITTLSLVM